MAFTYAITQKLNLGNVTGLVGTYTSNGGSTGGAIVLGTMVPVVVMLNSNSASPSEPQQVISGSTVTITTAANQTGTFLAIGS